MKKQYFSNLIPELATRAARATVSRLGFSNKPLRLFLSELFSAGYGQSGCFLGDPVFEATFGWKEAEPTLKDLAKSGVLAPELVNALDKPGKGKSDDCRFPKNAHPYHHQLEAWQRLSNDKPASVIVTSGTGSGKTECFMVPILNQLVRHQQENPNQALAGVESLLVYPLNALIQSQRERLDAWTAAFDGKIRYCLYNGNTPETAPQRDRDKTPNEVIDREMLRSSPPPMLVTNSTMLEYMLVRANDAPILEQSKGKLKWIVLDEAHTYIGSQAAELALLLRRVLHAFDVKPEDVRFVATSATIGSGEETKEQLQKFLAEIAGQPCGQVHVISGERYIPKLPEGNTSYSQTDLDTLSALADEERYVALCANTTARKIRDCFVHSPAQALKLPEVQKTIRQIQGAGAAISQQDALRWLDLLTNAVQPDTKKPFLPLRVHLFHNVVAGLWACADTECAEKKGTLLDDEAWKFGMVYTESRKHCRCGAPVYELRSCNDCNTTYLWARDKMSDNRRRLVQTHDEDADEFALEVELGDEDMSGETPEQESLTSSENILIANAHPDKTGKVRIDCETLALEPFAQEPQKTVALYLRSETQENNRRIRLSCSECGASYDNLKKTFRPAMLGAPFLLSQIVPTLFEFCPDINTADDKPLDRPMRGRRMISFTDSRQGTARLAVKLQQESERNRIRGLIYQYVVSKGRVAADAEAKKIEKELIAYKEALSHVPEAVREKIAKNMGIAEKEQRLATLQAPEPISISQLAAWLATNTRDVWDWMYRYYRELDPTVYGDSNGKEELARMLIAREFAERPKRANNLETMGLVQTYYPQLDKIKEAPHFSQLGVPAIDLTDWKDFLKICLDFYVRRYFFLDVKNAWRKTFGHRFSTKQFLPPDTTERPTEYLKIWPQCHNEGRQNRNEGRQNRLVRLLAYVLKLDPSSSDGKDAINIILRQAWECLVTTGILQRGAEGRYLALQDITLTPIAKAWVCPVTRRILDVTFRGITPWLPEKALSDKATKCRQIEIPQCDLLQQDFDNNEERRHTIREWTDEQPDIQELRAEGLWSDLNDRILEGGVYFRAAEHSAQQPGSKLSEYEGQFKRGLINLLSCSTTMELGVDIGGISVVAMNNVPPHPANYRQRAGRAGRRAETRSVALSLCKNNPHDQNVFCNTLWAFETQLPAPSVSLNSRNIIQRHINSMLLGAFMRKKARAASAEKLNMDWWMLPEDNARYQAFCAWVKCLDLQKETVLRNGLNSLLLHSPFEGTSLQMFREESVEMLKQHAVNWYAEYQIVMEELGRFADAVEKKDPACRALDIQKKRLTDEYLLRELASAGFLPGYSFPTDITSFDNLTYSELEWQKQRKTQDREDNRYRRRELPSRDTPMALREYAPGAEIVIDGLVYQSAGITMNWHRPAGVEDVNEAQNLRYAWRCTRCGSSGTTIKAEQLQECPDCGQPFSFTGRKNHFEYLEPSGFAVDFYAPLHNDISTQVYIPVAAPWVNARGIWLPLPNPALGLHRSSTNGMVFNYTAGAEGKGFAVCLSCGRAEPMTASDELPEVFRDTKTGKRKEHKRLRGRQGGQDSFCHGSDFALKPNLRLGHEAQTDVLELFLRGNDGAPIQDRKTAFSLAVAVRNAIAQRLGVELDELGCGTKPVRFAGDSIGLVIVIFDNHASGYCSSVSGRLPEILSQARRELECKAGCEDACQACLLDFNTRFHAENLNRHDALKFLTPQWLQQLALPEGQKYFGADSVAEHQTLAEAITRELAFFSDGPVRIFLSGDPDDWDIPASLLRKYVQQWSASEHEVHLVMDKRIVSRLSQSDAMALNALSMLNGVSLWTGMPPATQYDGMTLVAVGRDTAVVWATNVDTIGIPAANWGSSEGVVFVRGKADVSQIPFEPVALKPIVQEAGAHHLEIVTELDGSIDDFGKRMLQEIERALGKPLIADTDKVVHVTYNDRYLNSPLPLVLLLKLIGEIRCRYPDCWNGDALKLKIASTCGQSMSAFSPNRIWNDWPDAGKRNEVIIAACEYTGWRVELMPLDKRQVQHSRLLELHLQSGKSVKMWFDQGFGYWKVSNSTRDRYFPFNASSQEQVKKIADLKANIEGQNFATQIFIAR
jgi:ATP-dependent helicase YprA (DUF1998 family)/DNA-directed RNA polymerase subunit RPC12/RpoP